MEVGQTGWHLQDMNILNKNMHAQQSWLRTVEAEEKKFTYDRSRGEYLSLREWMLESQATNKTRGERRRHQLQQQITTYCVG